MSIYKPCDIRGNSNTELTPELYRSWGRALGGRVEPAAKFVVGGDVRGSTPRFLAGLVEGLCLAGVDVVDLGILPTPMIYYARHRLDAAACAIVTASHNPSRINGLKWMVGQHPPNPEEVDALRRQTETQDFERSGGRPSAPRTVDVTSDYVAWLQETWVDALHAQRHIVLDPMHGCWAGKARRYLQAIFPQCLFSAVHDTPDATFAGRDPDCSRAGLLGELCEEVYGRRAHLGIAFDGDGDRMTMVDNQGMVLTAEEATWLLLESFGAGLQKQRFVYDLKFSDRVAETAQRLGAEPVVERSGHAFIRTRMIECGALFGAEISGHYFFGALSGGDDGLFAACRVIAMLAQTETTLAEFRRRCPAVFMTPDLRLRLQPAAQQEVIERVRAAWSEYPQRSVDGVRIDLPGGWALVRRSVTEPALTFRFESADRPGLDHLVRRFCDTLGEFGDRLWAEHEAAVRNSSAG